MEMLFDYQNETHPAGRGCQISETPIENTSLLELSSSHFLLESNLHFT
jgi:hypothetical protein